MGKKAIVVGATSGIGRELVRLMAERGDVVVAIGRREDRLRELAAEFPDRALPLPHDVTDFESVPTAFDEAVRRLGGLDMIVYVAGVMPPVGPNEFNFAKDRAMIDVNFTGGVAWLNEAATRFANTRHGTIIGVGSVAGDRGRAGQPVYNASKAAFAAYLEALRNRLHKLGVKVVTIKPGPTETEMTAHLRTRGMASAEKVARKILAVADRPGEHYVKATHRIAFAIIRHIPGGLFRRLPL